MRELGSGLRLGMAAAAAVLMLAPAGFAKDKTANQAPQAWGMQSGQTGCVIFKESDETETNLVNGQMQYSTVKQLEVVEQENAKLPQKKYMETQDGLQALDTISHQDQVKFVRIPKKYTPDQLKQAEAMCKEGMAGQ